MLMQLIFSKLMAKYWPNVELVANKCAEIVGALERDESVEAYLASPRRAETQAAKRGSSMRKNKSPGNMMRRSQNFTSPKEAAPLLQN